MAHTIGRTTKPRTRPATPRTAVYAPLRGAHPDDVPRIGFHSDGRPHPRQIAMVTVAVVFALVAGACVFFRDMHVLGVWTAIVGVASGLAAQMFSATTIERMIIVLALGVSSVSLMLNMYHGGPY